MNDKRINEWRWLYDNDDWLTLNWTDVFPSNVNAVKHGFNSKS